MRTNSKQIEKGLAGDAKGGFSTRQSTADVARGVQSAPKDMTSLALSGGRAGMDNQGSAPVTLPDGSEASGLSSAYSSGGAPFQEDARDQTTSNSFASGGSPIVGNETDSVIIPLRNPRGDRRA